MANRTAWQPWRSLDEVLPELRDLRVDREELAETAFLVETLASLTVTGEADDHPFGIAQFASGVRRRGAVVRVLGRKLPRRSRKPREVWVFFVVCRRGPRVVFIGAATAAAFGADQQEWVDIVATRALRACV